MQLEEIGGIGPKTSSLLNKLDIFNVDDLITYYPRKYNILRRVNMDYIEHGDKVIIDGILEGQPTIVHLSGQLKKIIFRISNQKNIYNVHVYNQVYLLKELHYGMNIIIIGKYDKFKNAIIANEVRQGSISSKPQIEPVYYTTDGLNKKTLEKIIQVALLQVGDIIDYVPNYLKDRYHFPDKLWSIQQIHHPSDVLSYKKSLQRLKYEELFFYLLKINYIKNRDKFSDSKGVEKKFDEDKLEKFIENLKFELTKDQLAAINDIRKDMTRKMRMNRLIQGDVGSGKTVVAFIAGYINYLSGYQTALMVPTEILANQHYQTAMELFHGTGIRIGLLTSSTRKIKKNNIYDELKNGSLDFIIGTQSLIQEKLTYCRLGLIITDEQHRFGVNQRNNLKHKGDFPDVLSMSATPIPRTYALTIYGDMDVSNIKTKPVGRKEIITYYKSEKNMLEVLTLMKKELNLGHQIYVIAPSIEDNETDELNNVMKLSEKMKLAFGKIARIGVVHGRLDSDMKDQTMKDFEEKKIQILISTTVIEVGVNVPNASMIVIFNANLFGLSTLHQLRGRVGRGNIQSYCVLLSKEYNERLKMLEQCNDGFEISEYDFKNRGGGDLFGVRQSGEIGLKLANVRKDFDLLVRVKEDVNEFLKNYVYSDSGQLLLKILETDVTLKH